MKLQTFFFRQANELLGNIPAEPNEGCDEKEVVITFFIMPRNTSRMNMTEHFCMIIIIGEVAITERASL